MFEEAIPDSAVQFLIGIYKGDASTADLFLSLKEDNCYVSGSIMWVSSINKWIKMSETMGPL